MFDVKRRKTETDEEVCAPSNENSCSPDSEQDNRFPTTPKTVQIIADRREDEKEGFEYRSFPNEIWSKIVSFLAKDELMKISVVCKAIRSLAWSALWEKPSFKTPLSPRDLNKLKHLPIKQLNTKHLKIRGGLPVARRFKEIFNEMPKLQQVHVDCDDDWFGFREQSISMKALEIISPYVTSINMMAVVTRKKSSFISDLIAIDFPRLHSVTILRKPLDMIDRYERYDLRLLMKLPITRIHILSLKGDWDEVSGRLTYPHFALFPEMKHLKEIVLDSMDLDDAHMRVLNGLQERGVVLLRDRLLEELQ